ncbi:MAG: ribosome small subunit-dependent GTPase A [Planctomycetes bacterium]|nr:ribosome small subunit-dependent GTPase A [Planctomycetota bacterium]
MAAIEGAFPPGIVPARVLRQERDLYRVATAKGERIALVAGRLRYNTTRRDELPVPGDWVAVRSPPGDRATIQACLPRRSVLLRKAAGSATSVQALAANVDAALVVTAPDRDLNPRRIERYLAMIRAGGVAPHLVLNKVDLYSSEETRLKLLEVELSRLAPDVPIHRVSAQTGLGVAEVLAAAFGPGRSVAIIGSSGVGKSTLCNALFGEDLQDTGAERVSDARGRHTTTRRDLLLLPDRGGVVVDTPGLRELGLWEGGGLDATFPELMEVARGCRFRDCKHQGEPGCAVEEALIEGDLDQDRVRGYEKLRREVDRRSRRQGKAQEDRDKQRRQRRPPRRARSARRQDW